MYSHVFVGVRDFDQALAFYQPLMSTLGLAQRFIDRSRPWAGWQSSPGPRPLFLIGHPHDKQLAQPGNGQMVAWLADTRALVDDAHAVALAHGGSCAGAPGLRPDYHAHYYGAYFRDPDGNKLCVVCHTPPATVSTPTPAAAMAPSLSVTAALHPVLAELQRLEPLFHGAGPGATAAHFEELVAPEFWEVGASGQRYSRDFVLEVVKARSHEPDHDSWQTSDFHVSEVAPACYLLTYTLQQPGRLTRRATLWRRDGTRWQAVYHQGTVIARTS